jgi:putative two-component system response regulator
MQVLIVDDDPIAVEILKHSLVQEGHEVVTAENGFQALEQMSKHQCRLVITDWEMPEMDGIELCHAIRANSNGSYVYIILLTSHDSADERVIGLSAGADDFIVKPFHPTELGARIHSAERILTLETRNVAIFAMAKLAESRDPETGAHLERVQAYSRILAQHIAGLEQFRDVVDAEFIRLIYETSPLHDIGKVGIPDGVLLKAGRLTAEEYSVMKTHATIGADTLQAALDKFPNTPFLEMARDIAAAHHEKWDGSGYPKGLYGEQIPLAARIVALADVYDALSTKRVYKDAFTHDVTRKIILEGRGVHFDPAVVEAFLANEQQFVAVRTRFGECASGNMARAA